MIPTSEEFLNLISNEKKEVLWQMGTIDSAYVNGKPKIIFDGETTASVKEYTCLSSYKPAANDRVLLFKVGGSYVVAGSTETPSSEEPPVPGVMPYTHIQNSVSSNWTINHNLNRLPSVTVIDSGNTIVIGDVLYIDSNSLTLTFSAGFSGSAYLI